jgi:hypothetical protein
MKMMKMNEGQRGVGGNCLESRLLTSSASAITWPWQAPKRRLHLLPSPQCRVRLHRGRQQQPAHKNESRITINAAAAMRSNGPENRPAFSAARVKHQEHASTGTTSTARAPQPHLHSPHATPRHTLHHQLSPVPYPIGRAHIGRRSSLSLARDCHTAERGALEHTEDVPRKWSRWGGSACC